MLRCLLPHQRPSLLWVRRLAAATRKTRPALHHRRVPPNPTNAQGKRRANGGDTVVLLPSNPDLLPVIFRPDVPFPRHWRRACVRATPTRCMQLQSPDCATMAPRLTRGADPLLHLGRSIGWGRLLRARWGLLLQQPVPAPPQGKRKHGRPSCAFCGAASAVPSADASARRRRDGAASAGPAGAADAPSC